jgi:putative multicomponent Na+:H+ antiporter subunit B
MNDIDIIVITALLPLSALMVVLQVNPYHALVIQGILGAVAALIYAVLGAADVALTQALMGTLLAITLYAIAVRSSLIMRLGVLEDGAMEADDNSLRDDKAKRRFGQLMDDLRTIFGKRYMRLELVPYTNTQTLHRALMDKEVHATCAPRSPSEHDNQDDAAYGADKEPLHTAIRVRRIYDIMRTELSSSGIILTYVNVPDSVEEHK